MLTRRQRTALVQAVEQISAEVSSGLLAEPVAEPLGNEELALAIRLSLERMVDALDAGARHRHDHTALAIAAALDGAEAVMRGEVALGADDRLPDLLPAFVFLVSLPLVDQGRALELSKRCSQLLRGS